MSDRTRDAMNSLFRLESVIKIIGLVLMISGSYFSLSNKIENSSQQLVGVKNDISQIYSKLPNREAEEEKRKNIDSRIDVLGASVARLDTKVSDLDTWVRTTREKLAEKGWRP